MENNSVSIYGNMIDHIEYVPSSLTVTSGQKKDEPVKIEAKKGGWKVTARCGRKGSTEIGWGYWSLCGIFGNFCPGFIELSGGPGGSHGLANLFFTLKLYDKNGRSGVAHLCQAPFPEAIIIPRNYWWIGGSISTWRGSSGNIEGANFRFGDGAASYRISGDVSEIKIGE